MRAKTELIDDHGRSSPTGSASRVSPGTSSAPSSALPAIERSPTSPVARFIAGLLLIIFLAAAAWSIWLFTAIRFYANHDQAQPADAIAVFGAAEYDGHPSPTLKVRLDHALALYQRGLAPMVITLGGQGDAYHSEGSVGRDYLMTNGIPESHIIAETRSNNTESSAEQLAIIARANQMHTIVAVSDGTHLFRIRAFCLREGLEVFTSPHPPGRPISRNQRIERLAHEMLSYSLWRIGL